MTAFALLHGAYGSGSLFVPLVAELEARGHRAVAPDLPIDDPAAGFEAYADVVEAALDAVSDGSGEHVVGHSLGGVTAAYVAARRGAAVTYLAALLPAPLRPLAEVFREEAMVRPEVAAAEVPGDGGLRHIPAEAALDVLFSDLDRATAVRFAGVLRGQAVAPYFEPCPLRELPDGPYVVCRDDRVVSPEWGRDAARRRLGREPIELDAGHFVHVTAPERVADLLLEAAS